MYKLRLHSGRRQQHVRNIILGQLWTQVASVHHEHGRLTLATAGLLFEYLTLPSSIVGGAVETFVVIVYRLCCSG